MEIVSEERSERLRAEARQNVETRHAGPGSQLAHEGSKKKKRRITNHHYQVHRPGHLSCWHIRRSIISRSMAPVKLGNVVANAPDQE